MTRENSDRFGPGSVITAELDGLLVLLREDLRPWAGAAAMRHSVLESHEASGAGGEAASRMAAAIALLASSSGAGHPATSATPVAGRKLRRVPGSDPLHRSDGFRTTTIGRRRP